MKYSCDGYDQVISIFDGDSVQIGLTSNKILGTPTYVDFEDMKLPIPKNYDAYLKNLLGDYMQIPSKEQIEFKTHTPYILDLNHSYEEYKILNENKKIK